MVIRDGTIPQKKWLIMEKNPLLPPYQAKISALFHIFDIFQIQMFYLC